MVVTLRFLPCLLLVGFVAAASAHTCVHDDMPKPKPVSAHAEYTNHRHDLTASVEERSRRLAATVWEPIRIKVGDRNPASVGSAHSCVPSPGGLGRHKRADLNGGELFEELPCSSSDSVLGGHSQC